MSEYPEMGYLLLTESRNGTHSHDYIKLIEIGFPPHRQSRYNTPGDQDALSESNCVVKCRLVLLILEKSEVKYFTMDCTASSVGLRKFEALR